MCLVLCREVDKVRAIVDEEDFHSRVAQQVAAALDGDELREGQVMVVLQMH